MLLAQVPERMASDRRTSLIRLGLMASITCLLQACTASIVENGRAQATIVVQQDAPVEVLRAAKELQTYVQKTSGVELEIATTGMKPQNPVEIRLGVTPVKPKSGGDAATRIVHEDGYSITAAGRIITITGGSPRGTLYGVYDFIERALGVRWFMPTELGEDIVHAKTIRVPALKIVKNPAFPFIGGFSWAGSPGAHDWELRMRVRVGKEASFGHNWYNIHRFSKETFEKDPQMFALVGGKRGSSSQLCSSYPGVVQASAAAARRSFAANPEAPLFSISPNDGNGWCECDRCREVDALYGVTDGSLADRFVHYANQVLTDLEKTHKEKQVGIYAYVEHTAPPRKARPRANYVTALTHMPWEFCHVHPIADPSCPSNRRYLSYLKGWQAITRHVGVYEYYGHFFAFTPWPIVHSIRHDIPLFKELGIERFTSETQQNWANQGINFYVAAKLVEDPSRDVDALLSEYFSRFYGKAREPMRRYFDLWENAMQKTSEAGDRGYAWMSMFTPALVAEAETLLREAEQLSLTDTEKHRGRVAFARLGFGYTEAFARMLDAGLRKDVRGVIEWSEEARKRVKATEGSAPQAFFVSLAMDNVAYIANNILVRGVPLWVALRPPPEPVPSTTP